tara:strand:- start:5530 stop:6207 length:678 start_codon:yes stop_codon:yes gene_type:complete
MAKLIVLEGPDGVGKTTTKEVIENQLKILGKTFETARHPGETKMGSVVRDIFISKEMDLSTLARVYLIAANKVELMRQVINESKADYVILDRFDLSTVIYQSVGMMIEAGVGDDNRLVFDEAYKYIYKLLVNDIDHSKVDEINYIVLDNHDDVLDVRLGERDKDAMESMGNRFHRLVREKYRDGNLIKDFIYRYPVRTTLAFTTTNSLEDIKTDMELHLGTLVGR